MRAPLRLNTVYVAVTLSPTFNRRILTGRRVASISLLLLFGSYSVCAAYFGGPKAAKVAGIRTGVFEFASVTAGAEIAFDDCSKSDPDSTIAACTAVIQAGGAKGVELGAAFFIRANAYERKGDHEHAIADYTESLRLSPGNGAALKNRGAAYARKGDYDRAIQDFEQVRLGRADAKVIEMLVIVYNNRGLGFGKQNDYDRAIQDFDKALALNPNFTEALRNRAAFSARKGDWDRAVQDLVQVLRLLPNDPGTIDSLLVAYNGRAHDYVERVDYDHAIQDCEEALRLRPNDAETLQRLVGIYNNRGLASARQGDYEHGIQDLDKAVTLNPEDAQGFHNRGLIEAYKGNSDRALQDFDQALRLNPKLTVALLARGAAHYDRHEFEQALKDYDEVLRLDPENTVARFEREKTLFVTGELNRSPEVASISNRNASPGALAIRNLPAFQSTFGALQSAGAYRGFEWPGVYEISNPTSKQVAIADFRVLWPPASFEGQELRLVARSRADRINVFDDLDTLIESQKDKSDLHPMKFPTQIPPHTKRYVIVHFIFDLSSTGGRPLEFQDQSKAYKLLSAALGWKLKDDGSFDCVNEDITVEITTPGPRRLKFTSLTGLMVPGCQMHLPLRSAPPFTVNVSKPSPENVNNTGLDPKLGFQSHVTKGLSTAEYTKIILREPSNADAFNERGKAYRAIGDFDHAINDFTEAIRLRPFFPEAKNNLQETQQAKAKAACGFRLDCNR